MTMTRRPTARVVVSWVLRLVALALSLLAEWLESDEATKDE